MGEGVGGEEDQYIDQNIEKEKVDEKKNVGNLYVLL